MGLERHGDARINYLGQVKRVAMCRAVFLTTLICLPCQYLRLKLSNSVVFLHWIPNTWSHLPHQRWVHRDVRSGQVWGHTPEQRVAALLRFNWFNEVQLYSFLQLSGLGRALQLRLEADNAEVSSQCAFPAWPPSMLNILLPENKPAGMSEFRTRDLWAQMQALWRYIKIAPPVFGGLSFL